MKKLFILFFIVLSSCTPKVVPWSSKYEVYGFDFTKYSDKGFLFTPESFQGAYTSRGLIEIMFYPSVSRAPKNAHPIDGYIIKKEYSEEIKF